MKSKSSFVLVIFFVFLLAIPLSLPFDSNAAVETAVLERGEVERTPEQSAPNLTYALKLIQQGKITDGLDILLSLFTSREFVQKFENLINEKIPFHVDAIRISKAVDRSIIKLAYGFTDDRVIPADMTLAFYYDTEFEQLLFTPTMFDSHAKQIIDDRIQNYQELIQLYPDTNFYLYYHQTLHNSEFHPLNPVFPEADSGRSLAYFEQNLPDGLTFGKFLLTSHEDHLEYYYRTDHHWRVNAIIRAYQEIYTMLSKNYPGMSQPLTMTKTIEFPDINFLGMMARRDLYPVKADEFVVEDVILPAHDLIESGQKVDYDRRAIYFEGKYSTIPYINHYNAFYGEVADLIEYDFHNTSDRNLLIIGSSYQNSLDPLLASHYDKTYCVDLRYYTDFSLSAFLSEREVDDILIIGDNEVAFQDVQRWKIYP